MQVSNTNKRFTRKPSTDPAAMMLGKIPPQARELEEAILGAIMLEKTAFDVATEILSPACFYVEAHQRIYECMPALSNKPSPIDLLTVVEELRFNGNLEFVGGPYYLTKLTNAVVSTANIEAHCRIVVQKFIQRELIRIGGEILGEAYEDTTDVFDMLDEAEGKLFELTNNHLRKNFDSIDTVIAKAVQRIEDMRTRKDEMTGVPTGFPKLDRITYGWQQTDLIILAARPSVGKTAFALNLARSAAMHPTKPTPIAFFSLEMSNAQLVTRLLSAESELRLEKISRGQLEEYEVKQLYKKGVDPLMKAKIFIDDTAALNIFELRAKCRRLKNKENIGLIIIDYLQLMSGSGDRNSNREQEISKISRDLKGLAKELQVPIIALSQLSREVEKRKEGSKIPQLSDLRESGAIEQDADMVMFLYRPDYYENMLNNEHGESQKGETFIKIAKHRNGSLETVKLRANLSIQKFVEDESGDNSVVSALPKDGNWRAISDSDDAGGNPGGPNLFIQKGSRMNDDFFDDSPL